ncbi:hypothetical protein EBR57_10690, partial [bacterium]|nr:hypothetical protein [bacterium]
MFDGNYSTKWIQTQSDTRTSTFGISRRWQLVEKCGRLDEFGYCIYPRLGIRTFTKNWGSIRCKNSSRNGLRFYD